MNPINTLLYIKKKAEPSKFILGTYWLERLFTDTVLISMNTSSKLGINTYCRIFGTPIDVSDNYYEIDFLP